MKKSHTKFPRPSWPICTSVQTPPRFTHGSPLSQYPKCTRREHCTLHVPSQYRIFFVSTQAGWYSFSALEWMPFSTKKPGDNSCQTLHTLPSFGKPGLRSSSVSACSSESLLIQEGYLCLLLMSKRQDSRLNFENYIIQAAELQASYARLYPKILNTSS